MKVGRDPEADPHRLAVARDAVGQEVALMVDANGAFRSREAADWAQWYGEQGVVWFEEPVSSDDVAGLRHVRDAAPRGMDVTAGEYVWSLFDAQRLLEAGAVDVLQVDITRCGGLTELMRIDGLAKAHHVPLSAHCAPALSAQAFCAVEDLMPLEYFHDHARVEHLLFDGLPVVRDGAVVPDLDRPGNGLGLRVRDAERFRSG
jgi:L-alanine-DL-glutamate epimerase-like enolase superfamily enzyme